MLDLSKRKKISQKNKIKPAQYPSVVKAVEETDGYIEGTSVTIRYILTDCNGKKLEYSELFHITERNKRTCDFLDYLEENGIEDLADFVGCQEMLTLAKDGTRNGLIRICEREFLDKEVDSVDVGV